MLTIIFCVIDDFCKEFEEEFPKHSLENSGSRKRRRSSQLSTSEMLTILVYFHHSSYKNFKRYYEELIRFHLKDCFGRLVSYSRFLRLAARCFLPMLVFSHAYNSGEDGSVFFVDSMPLKVCHNKRILSHKTFKNIAKRGKSSMGWFFGFKLHFIINHEGEMVNFLVTPGNVSDKNKKVIDFLTKNIQGKLFGDKGYISSSLFKKLFEKGIQIITKIRKNMKNCLMDMADKLLLKKRGLIESVGNLLKNFHQIEHSRHRSIIGLMLNVFSAISAYHFKETKPSICSKKHIPISSQ